MSGKSNLTDDEIKAAQQLLNEAGRSFILNPGYGMELSMFARVLEAKEKMVEEIRQIRDEHQTEAEWRWRDNKEDKRIAREIRVSLGLED
jgi:CRISPR/Cas system-associated protein endoribonuclease Cas2